MWLGLLINGLSIFVIEPTLIRRDVRVDSLREFADKTRSFLFTSFPFSSSSNNIILLYMSVSLTVVLFQNKKRRVYD